MRATTPRPGTPTLHDRRLIIALLSAEDLIPQPPLIPARSVRFRTVKMPEWGARKWCSPRPRRTSHDEPGKIALRPSVILLLPHPDSL